MSKRPSLVEGLVLDGKPTAAAPSDASQDAPGAEAMAPQAEPVGEPKAKGRRTRPEVVHTSVYLPREVHRRLREIAFARDVKVHDVIMEGIDAALQNHGHPSVENLKAGAKRGG